MSYIDRAGLAVAEPLARFVEERVLSPLGLDAGDFWAGVAAIFADFAPRNVALLARRDALQAAIDAAPKRSGDEGFLRDIGYLIDEPAPFTITTADVDDEVARLAGPQLVVPSLNARFALNAANARWGSLYDALYGTDAIPGEAAAGGYDAARGALVIARAKAFLDEAVPLSRGRWADFAGGELPLADPGQFVGARGQSMLFVHHGLHIEVVVDRAHPIGRDDPAGIADVVLEAALSTIVDLEDSVAAVDADDKVAAYANWLGLMRGDLEDSFEKAGGW